MRRTLKPQRASTEHTTQQTPSPAALLDTPTVSSTLLQTGKCPASAVSAISAILPSAPPHARPPGLTSTAGEPLSSSQNTYVVNPCLHAAQAGTHQTTPAPCGCSWATQRAAPGARRSWWKDEAPSGGLAVTMFFLAEVGTGEYWG
jgi:hypothetical protein